MINKATMDKKRFFFLFMDDTLAFAADRERHSSVVDSRLVVLGLRIPAVVWLA